jgi:hypothetical protein
LWPFDFLGIPGRPTLINLPFKVPFIVDVFGPGIKYKGLFYSEIRPGCNSESYFRVAEWGEWKRAGK